MLLRYMFATSCHPPSMSQEVQARTLGYNEHLMKWGETKAINMIRTASTFMLSSGEVCR